MYLQVPRRQFYCPHCKQSPTERLAFLEMRRKSTIRCEEYIYERVKELTVEKVSRNEKLSAARGKKFSKDSSAKKKDWGTPQRLSLDEFSRQTGKRDFVTVVSDIDKGTLLSVIDSHKSEDIIATLNEQPQEMREQVEEVSVDMWG